ncbi:MAG: type IV pilus secretin PilQ [Rhodocyclaceae bacterium]|nr:type IV pilus secretin PilQ [Rhodocyclaceae bacterium]
MNKLLMILAMLGMLAPAVQAQQKTEQLLNKIENLQVAKSAGVMVLQIGFSAPLVSKPSYFSISNPARLVFDFPGVGNGLGYTSKAINDGGIISLNVVQAGDRSRFVLNLEKPFQFELQQEGKQLTISLIESEPVAAEVATSKQTVQNFSAIDGMDELQIKNIQFRRGKDGAGIVAVDLSTSNAGVDVRQRGKAIYVTFKNAKLPSRLSQQLDVIDFATPVSTVKTRAVGSDVSMEIMPQGLWEHVAFQTDNQFVVEVRPVKEDPNKLFQGSRGGYQGEPISLNFQNIPLRELLHVFADITNFNIVVSDSVSGNVSLRLNDVPWDHALEIVLQQKNLAMRKSGNVLWIAPRDELAARDKTEAEAREAAVAAEIPRLEVFQLNYQKAEDVEAMLMQGNKPAGGNTPTAGLQQSGSFISAQGRVTIDKRTNQLFIFDVPSKLELVRGLLSKIDRPVRQVMIEARIVEADTNFTKQLGVKIGAHDHRGMNVGHPILGQSGFRFGLAGSNKDAYAHLPEAGRYPATAIITDVDQTTGEVTYTREVPTPVLADSQMVNLGVTNPAGQIALTLMNAAKTQLLSLELSALEADGKGKIVSSPRIMTMDQMKANIQQGVRIPYLTQSASGATAVQWQNANLSLEVTPQITPDGKVMMDLKITKNALGQFISAMAGYSIKTKELDSKVLVENGGTVVIGGIYEQEESESVRRVPFLGDLPYVGFLFKQREKRDNRVELLIMITPKIIDNALALK